jgi:hypothetical protein
VIAQVDPVALAPYLAGPGAATLVLLLVGAACYRLVVSHLVPLATTSIDRHLKQFDALIESQKLEAQQTTKALTSLDKAVRALERRIAHIDGATGWGADGDGGSIARRAVVDGDGRAKP